MFIQTEDTPNPLTIKFLPGKTVMKSGTADFRKKELSENSPLASRLFEIDGVSWDLANEALKLASAKLPINTRIVRRLGDTG